MYVYTWVLCVSSFTHGHVCADFTKLYIVDVWECMCIHVCSVCQASHMDMYVLTSQSCILWMYGNVCVYTCVLDNMQHASLWTSLLKRDYVQDKVIKLIQCLIQSTWKILRIDLILFLHVYASNKKHQLCLQHWCQKYFTYMLPIH